MKEINIEYKLTGGFPFKTGVLSYNDSDGKEYVFSFEEDSHRGGWRNNLERRYKLVLKSSRSAIYNITINEKCSKIRSITADGEFLKVYNEFLELIYYPVTTFINARTHEELLITKQKRNIVKKDYSAET